MGDGTGAEGRSAVRELFELARANERVLDEQMQAVRCLTECVRGGDCNCDLNLEKSDPAYERRASSEGAKEEGTIDESDDVVPLTLASAERRELRASPCDSDESDDPLAPWRDELPSLKEQYARDGYVVVSGLIEDETLTIAEAAVWNLLAIERNDTTAWPERRFFSSTMGGPEISALWTPAYRAMAQALYPEDEAPVLLDWHRNAERGWFAEQTEAVYNESGLAMHVFPLRNNMYTRKEWKPPTPHLDHASQANAFRSCCLPMRMSTMTYLTSSPETHHGGSTVVWPKSHRLVADLAVSDPERFEMLHTLAHSLEEAGVQDLEPLELKVGAGDVLFHDMFTAHYGSENHAPGKPRLAFNMKWGSRGAGN